MTEYNQYGHVFIPPYSFFPAADPNTGMFSTLHFEATDNHVSSNFDFIYEGFDDHAFSGTASIPDTPHHTENTGIPFHHRTYFRTKQTFVHNGHTYNAGTTLNPYLVYGDGNYTGVIENGLGVPWKSSQGVDMLWKSFYGDFYQISELEWNTEQHYYHYLFGKYLSDFTLDFLPMFARKAGAPAVGHESTASDDGFYYYTNITVSTNAKKQFAIEQTPNFLNAYEIVMDDQYPDIMNDIVDSWITNQSTLTLQQWFLNHNTADTWFLQDSASLKQAWEVFLDASNIRQRRNSTFMWVMREVIQLLMKLEAVAASQSNRLLTFSEAEQDATKRASAVRFCEPSSAKDYHRVNWNSYMMSYLQFYRTNQDIASKQASQANSAVGSTQTAMSDQSSTMSTLLKQMEGLIRNIFNR